MWRAPQAGSNAAVHNHLAVSFPNIIRRVRPADLCPLLPLSENRPMPHRPPVSRWLRTQPVQKNYETNPRPKTTKRTQASEPRPIGSGQRQYQELRNEPKAGLQNLLPMPVVERVLIPFLLPTGRNVVCIRMRRLLPPAGMPHVAASIIAPISRNPYIARPGRYAVRLNLQRRRRHRSIIGNSNASTTSRQRNDRE